MRALCLAVLMSFGIFSAAIADETVSGKWHATLGSGVSINMNVGADGAWSSETRQKNKIVRQMKGTYTQTPSNAETGTLVFTPTQATVQSGDKAEVETDQYEVVGSGKTLKLTSDGDTMVFQKLAH